MSRIKNGVRVSRCRTYPSRFSDGKVHLLTWREATDGVRTVAGRKMWLPACSDQPYHAEDLPDSDGSPVTCHKCLATGLVPSYW
jgi:hypothetical protein